jgi:hypothetical protein
LIACQASLHYGERWGRLWLDAARYADSDGYENDKQRWVCFYRDWVINALNHDMPFDEFTIEQLAGELLPHATLDQKIATGFHRNTMINEEGGVDQEQYRIEALFDRVATTGTVFLGLTLGCAQCHDHKLEERDKPRTTHVLIRGDFLKPGVEVSRNAGRAAAARNARAASR